MERQKKLLLLFFCYCFFLFLLFSEIEGVQGSSHHNHHRGLYGSHPTKLFVFGDSYADTGNNRKSLANSWKVPYGVTFPGKPAGRFSDGRVLTDYLAKFLGLKSPIPYRWRKYAPNRLSYGMNFAYGGTGVFDTLVLDPNMTTQIDFFQNLINHDSVYTTLDLKSSLALVTVSGNDYGAFLAKGGSALDLPSFIIRLVDQLVSNLKRIHGMGVRKVAVTALQPLGCLPRSTIIKSFQQCNATENTAVDFHNLLLREAVTKLNNESKDSTFVILDLYSAFISVLKNEGDFLGSLKFETPLKPCCMGVSSDYYCGSMDHKGSKMYTVCDNPEAAFFWDMVHPTQAGWRAVYLALKSTLEQIN